MTPKSTWRTEPFGTELVKLFVRQGREESCVWLGNLVQVKTLTAAFEAVGCVEAADEDETHEHGNPVG